MLPFVPAWWLPNGHLQTIWASKVGRHQDIRFNFEHFAFADGDETSIAWFPANLSLDSITNQETKSPIVVVLHGLEGSAESHYTKGMMNQLAEQGWRGVVLHFRGCHGGPNKLDRSYHSGDTDDLRAFLAALKARIPDTPIFAVGYSLGGNVLLKYLGESGTESGIEAAVAVSVPFKLDHAAARLNRGASKLYQHVLLSSLKRKFFEKFASKTCPVDQKLVSTIKTIEHYDDIVTAPLHGFKNAADYYSRSSCYRFLSAIRTPTLVIHAEDDPLVPSSAIPLANDLSPLVELECFATGGHVAFIAGSNPAQPDYWLDRRISHFLSSRTESSLLT